MTELIRGVRYTTVVGDLLGRYEGKSSRGQEFNSPYVGKGLVTVDHNAFVERYQTEHPIDNRTYIVSIENNDYTLHFEGRRIQDKSKVIYYKFKGFEIISSNDCNVFRCLA